MNVDGIDSNPVFKRLNKGKKQNKKNIIDQKTQMKKFNIEKRNENGKSRFCGNF